MRINQMKQQALKDIQKCIGLNSNKRNKETT